MKNLLLISLAVLLSLSSYGQEITGSWYGTLKTPGGQLRLVINIEQTPDGYSSTLDSPDQGAMGIPVSKTHFQDAVLTFQIDRLVVTYSGTLTNQEVIKGTFEQNGQAFPLDFSRKEVEVEQEVLVRPQEPKKPYPYYSEAVLFENPIDSITLAGTLTLPTKEGKYPVVVMITGSGPQNRDEELLGHKPFLVIADHLTRNGIGVLRFDDRGVAESTGDFQAATSADFATDVLSAIEYLKTRGDVDFNNIGLVGHSEGGLIAPMVAAESSDVAFIVLLAGPGISGDEILLLQSELIAKAGGADNATLEPELELLEAVLDIVKKGNTTAEIKTTLTSFIQDWVAKNPDSMPEGTDVDSYVNSTVNQLATPWFRYFLNYEPASSLVKVKCPVLAINGEKDLQVPSKVNLDAIKKYLEAGGNTNFMVKEFPNLNHLFQESATGAPNEYEQIEQTFSPVALLEISNWILTKIN